MKKQQSGFGAIELILIVVILGVLGFVGWKVLTTKSDTQPSAQNQNTEQQNQNQEQEQTSNEPKQLIWQQTTDSWQASQTAPACPTQPMLKSPADISKATAVLYPGQPRGGNYKPHGGLRFDSNSNNAVEVTAPIDGFLVRGAGYIEQGEVQYMLDVMNNCGIMYRVDHIRELPDNLQKIADTWPEPGQSSATQPVTPAVYIEQGEVLATKVGFINSKNTSFDFGVYDFRSQNEASKSAAFQAAHTEGKELSWHAVCWLKDWLPTDDSATLAQLPAGDPGSGTSSDYCK